MSATSENLARIRAANKERAKKQRERDAMALGTFSDFVAEPPQDQTPSPGQPSPKGCDTASHGPDGGGRTLLVSDAEVAEEIDRIHAIYRGEDRGKDYLTFIASKRLTAPATGIAAPPDLSPMLFGFQRDLTTWALRRGRGAIFADTGLGKGWMILEFARVVAAHTDLPFLILAPLAVSKQFEREAIKLGSSVTICGDQADVRPGINVTNYAKLHRFDAAAFGGIALDESSILKSLDGKTRIQLIESFRECPFKLCATATPSPNDHTELGGHAEFLGVMNHAEMLATFFTRDGGSTQDWRIKGHARDAFWSWVCSWGAIVKQPSDIGGDDTGYILPPLNYHEHVVPMDHSAPADGFLFARPAETMQEERAARRSTLDARVVLAVNLIKAGINV